MKVVELEGVCVERGERRTLGPVDLGLEERSWTLVVGPSGSGKTTLLRAIAGLVRPCAGRIALAGRPASDGARLLLPPEERGIGFVFQGAGAGLWPHLSARATLEFVLACQSVRRAGRAARASEMLELVGLRGLEDRRPGELSGGEAQRLALARALVGRPRLLLLDEPLGALDAALRLSMVELLAETHRRLSLTILHVTHDPCEGRSHAGQTVVMDSGRIHAPDGAAP